MLIGKREGKSPPGKPRRKWEDNSNTDLKDIGYEGVGWVNLHLDRDQSRDGINTRNFQVHTMRVISDQLSDY
jgi:hypothetical protein